MKLNMIPKRTSPLIILTMLANIQWSCSGGGGGENTANLSPQVTISYPTDNSSVVGNAVYSLKFSETVTGLTGNNLNAACEGSIQLSPDNGGNCYPISIKSIDNISWTVDPVGELSDGAYTLTVTTHIQNLSALSPSSPTSVTFNVKDALSTVANQLESDLIKADLSKDLAEAAKAGARTSAGSEKNDLLSVIPAAFDGAFDAVANAAMNENLTQVALSAIIESLLSNVAGQASLVSDHSASRVAVLPPNFSSLLKSLTTRVATKSASSITTLQTLATALVSSLPAAGATAIEIETTYVRSIVQTATTVVMTTNTDKTARDSVLAGLGTGVVAGAKRITEMTVNVDTIQTTTTESMTAAANSSDVEYDVSTVTTAIVTAVNTVTPTSIVDETAPASCSLNGQTVAHGSTLIAYQASSVAFGNTCTSETRSCSDGTLSGAYTNTSCAVADAAGCSLNGQTVAHGSTLIAYQASSVAFGNTCISETRSCSDGTLSGAYTNTSCVVADAASCSLNGQTVAHGSAVTAYQASSVAFGNTCNGETRSCSDGNLTGSYAYTSCSVNPASQSSSEHSADGTTFKITVKSPDYYSNKYYVDGVQTKSLNLKKGFTYYFNVEDSSTNNHPLFIGTTSGGGNYNNEYSSGITNSRATGGILTFTVPNDAPSTLFYNCGIHSSMGGVINTSSSTVPAETSPAPSPPTTPPSYYY